MTREQLKAKFPLEGEITQSIVNIADPQDVCGCAGFITAYDTMRAAGIPFTELHWGAIDGTFHLEGEESECAFSDALFITTKEKVNFMKAEPQKVTFVLYEPNSN